MNSKGTQSIAGISLGGGLQQNIFFCLLEYFEDKGRWFLTSLHQLKEEEPLSADEAVAAWVAGYQLKKLMVDFPLTTPECESCTLVCPGEKNCHHPKVTQVRKQISTLLEADRLLEEENPKRYEQQRNEEELIDPSKDLFFSGEEQGILSRSFKRRLKKGFLPYWNRPVDFWIWKNYYNQVLKVFKVSFDSFGDVSTMLLKRFEYLKRHFPKGLRLYETDRNLILLELYRAKIVTKKNLVELIDFDLSPFARMQIAKAIETHCNLFIYQHDLDLIAKNVNAFDSFILAVAGMQLLNGKVKRPDVAEDTIGPEFIVPVY
jgi:hypothetical protein